MRNQSRWACFNCCKSFSRSTAGNHTAAGQPVKCNECSQTMVDMGRFFPAPRKRDRKRWKIMQLLARYRYRFDDPARKEYIELFITGNYKLPLQLVEANIRNKLGMK